MTDIKIDGEAMQAMVLKSILDSWDEETRESLITQALKSLLGPAKENSWNDKTTVLEKVLDGAVREAARKVVLDMMSRDVYTQKTEALATPLLDKAFETGEYVDEVVVDALIQKIKSARGY